jgi:hypothetical protein
MIIRKIGGGGGGASEYLAPLFDATRVGTGITLSAGNSIATTTGPSGFKAAYLTVPTAGRVYGEVVISAITGSTNSALVLFDDDPAGSGTPVSQAGDGAPRLDVATRRRILMHSACWIEHQRRRSAVQDRHPHKVGGTGEERRHICVCRHMDCRVRCRHLEDRGQLLPRVWGVLPLAGCADLHRTDRLCLVRQLLQPGMIARSSFMADDILRPADLPRGATT